jgi:hypothetical protein
MRILFSIVIALLFSNMAYAVTPEAAYVFEYNDRGQDYMVKFDTTTDTTLEKIPLDNDKGFNNMTIDENGGVYLSCFRTADDFCRDIYYYDAKKDRIDHYKDLGKFTGPSYIALTKNDLIVQILGEMFKSPRRGGLVFIDRATGNVTAEIIFEKDPQQYSQADTVMMSYDGKRTIALSSFYCTKFEDYSSPLGKRLFTGEIYIVDTQLKRTIRVIEVPIEYKYLNGICIVGDKVYLSSFRKGFHDPDAGIDLASNNDLLVFSISSGKLIKKIKISPHPRKLVIDRSVNKIYVMHLDDDEVRDIIEVVDTRTDKVIDRLKIPTLWAMSAVAPGKLYAVVEPESYNDGADKPHLLVIDTKTDKIIKKIYGNFETVSVNNKYW